MTDVKNNDNFLAVRACCALLGLVTVYCIFAMIKYLFYKWNPTASKNVPIPDNPVRPQDKYKSEFLVDMGPVLLTILLIYMAISLFRGIVNPESVISFIRYIKKL